MWSLIVCPSFLFLGLSVLWFWLLATDRIILSNYQTWRTQRSRHCLHSKTCWPSDTTSSDDLALRNTLSLALIELWWRLKVSLGVTKQDKWGVGGVGRRAGLSFAYEGTVCVRGSCLSVCLSVHPSISVCLSIPVCLSFCPSLSVCLLCSSFTQVRGGGV